MPRTKKIDTADALEQLSQLEKVVKWMIAHKIIKLNLHGRAEIQLDPSALLATPRSIPDKDALAGVKERAYEELAAGDLCGCSHSMLAMHTLAGCIGGCSYDLCLASLTKTA